MSETPRTDEQEFQAYTNSKNTLLDCVWSDFARQLERELNGAVKEIHQHQLCQETILALNDVLVFYRSNHTRCSVRTTDRRCKACKRCDEVLAQYASDTKSASRGWNKILDENNKLRVEVTMLQAANDQLNRDIKRTDELRDEVERLKKGQNL